MGLREMFGFRPKEVKQESPKADVARLQKLEDAPDVEAAQKIVDEDIPLHRAEDVERAHNLSGVEGTDKLRAVDSMSEQEAEDLVKADLVRDKIENTPDTPDQTEYKTAA